MCGEKNENVWYEGVVSEKGKEDCVVEERLEFQKRDR